MTPVLLHRLIVAVSDEVIAHADELTALDQAVGDGDHGINMKRASRRCGRTPRRRRRSRCPKR